MGRGLDVLLSRTHSEPLAGVRDVPLSDLLPSPFQPRQHFHEEELQELADSIKQQGVIQPVIARSRGDRFEIIEGERRVRAAQLAGLQTVPVLLRSVDDREALLMALVENMARSDLNPLEEARGLYRLLDEFGLTHQEVAEQVGRSRSQVSNTLRLLGLSEKVKMLLEAARLEMGHARALLGLRTEWQDGMAERVVAEGWSVRKTEQEVARCQMQKQISAGQAGGAASDPNIDSLTRRLSDAWGLAVEVQTRAKGKGKLVIHYENWADLEPLLEKWDLLEEDV